MKLLGVLLRYIWVGGSNGMGLLHIRGHRLRGWGRCWRSSRVRESPMLGVHRVRKGSCVLWGWVHTHRHCRVHRGSWVDRR